MNKRISDFTDEVKQIYETYSWPGNVRELENAVEYGINMAFNDKIGIDAVPARLLKKDINMTMIKDSDLPLSEQIKNYEKAILLKKLQKYGSSSSAKDKVAKDLGLSRATLYRKLADYDLN